MLGGFCEARLYHIVSVGKWGCVTENEGADALGNVLSMSKWYLMIV